MRSKVALQLRRAAARVGPLFGFALLAVALTTGRAMSSEPPGSFSQRLTVPRVAPIAKDAATPEQQAMLASRPDYNIYTTLAHHTELYSRWSPLGQFLLNGSSLPARERELVMLRMGWLCQSEYEWSQHARIAQSGIAQGGPGLTAQDIKRIALGPQAQGWSPFDRTLLTMVDELRYDTQISDATWQQLRGRYSVQQVIEVLYTAAQYQLVSMALNSLGVQLDPVLKDRLPMDLPKPRLAGVPDATRLGTPRVEPVPEAQWSQRQRELIAEQLSTGRVFNLYSTLLHHPDMYEPRRKFGRYIQRESRLPPQTRELLIMRTAWLIRSEYEWAHHVSQAKDVGFTDADLVRSAAGAKVKGWSAEHAAVLQAADELRREAFIADATWRELAKHYDTQQLVEIIFTVGGYTMTGLAINSLGIQIEPGFPRFPPPPLE